MKQNETNFGKKNSEKYYCSKCDYKCYNTSSWNRHVLTRKHQNETNETKMKQNLAKIAQIDYECICGQKFSSRTTMWRHKKRCSMLQEGESENTIIKEPTQNDKSGMTQKLIELILSKNQDFMTELVTNLTTSNQDVVNKMVEIMPTLGNNSHNTNSHNTTNNQFNIQMFLNNHCKNAMNLTDFIDSLPITAETYDSNIDHGLTKTITNMFTAGLNQLDVLERPIHCTDASRKTLYVKEGDIWEKDNELIKMIQGIRQMAAKQRILINKWRDAHDDWNVNDRMQDRFTTLVCNMVEDIENQEKETNKIIRSVGRQVYLNSEVENKYLE